MAVGPVIRIELALGADFTTRRSFLTIKELFTAAHTLFSPEIRLARWPNVTQSLLVDPEYGPGRVMSLMAEPPSQQGPARQPLQQDAASTGAFNIRGSRDLDTIGEGTANGHAVPLPQLLHAFATAGSDWRVSHCCDSTLSQTPLSDEPP